MKMKKIVVNVTSLVFLIIQLIPSILLHSQGNDRENSEVFNINKEEAHNTSIPVAGDSISLCWIKIHFN